MAPSSAKVSSPDGAIQATVVNRPASDRSIVEPVFTSTNEPVP